MKVGIIGAGQVGGKRAESIAAFSPEDEIVFVCDKELAKAKDLSTKWGGKACQNWEDVVASKEVQVVVVATPNKYLREISVAALENGKNVLCEKPLGKNAREAKEIYLRAKKNKKILKTGFNHRHHQAISEAKRLVDEGELGDIYYAKCSYGHGGRPGYEKEWRASKEWCGGGELLDQGVHVVDLFRWFMGEFAEAFGTISTYYWNMEVEDNAFAIFQTKKGHTALMHTSWTQWKNRFIFEIFGEKGYVIIDGLGGSYGIEKLIIGKRRKGKTGECLAESSKEIRQNDQNKSEDYLGGPPEERVLEFFGPDTSWREEWKEFTSAIKENREPIGSGYDGWMANRMIEAVYKSARMKKPVRMTPVLF